MSRWIEFGDARFHADQVALVDVQHGRAIPGQRDARWRVIVVLNSGREVFGRWRQSADPAHEERDRLVAELEQD